MKIKYIIFVTKQNIKGDFYMCLYNSNIGATENKEKNKHKNAKKC